MTNNRIIIRLIDVALIILLGFIAISRLKTEFIDLPSGADAAKSSGEFYEASLRIHPDAYEVIDQNRKKNFEEIDELEAALTALNKEHERKKQIFVLNIESSGAVMIQRLIDVIDLCQRNRIQKNLSYVAFE